MILVRLPVVTLQAAILSSKSKEKEPTKHTMFTIDTFRIQAHAIFVVGQTQINTNWKATHVIKPKDLSMFQRSKQMSQMQIK